MSPSVSNVVAPSPMKKKLSLSQYTSRKAKRNEALAAAADKEKATTTNSEAKDTSKPQETAKEGPTTIPPETSTEGDKKAEAEAVKVESTNVDS